jgi:very-short-patch-repair endonuclease
VAKGAKAVFEYDGAEHDEPVNHGRDVARWRALRAAGYEIFPYTARDFYSSPAHIVVDCQRAVGLPIDATAVQGWLREWKKSGWRNRPRRV